MRWVREVVQGGGVQAAVRVRWGREVALGGGVQAALAMVQHMMQPMRRFGELRCVGDEGGRKGGGEAAAH